MSTLAQVREAIKTTLEASLAGTGMTVYTEIPETVKVPACIPEPDNADYAMDFASGATWNLELVILTQRVDSERGQRELDQYIDTEGVNSIPAIIRANSSLGLTDVDSMCKGMSKYGAAWAIGGISYVGAVIKLMVVTF